MFLTATNLLCTLFTGPLTRKNIEKNFSSRLLPSVKLRVNLGLRDPCRHFLAPQLRPPVIHGSTALVAPIDGAQLATLTVREHHHLRELPQ
jgi:hypothetical protein